MAEMSWEHAAEARAALNAIVTDPEHGVAALSSAQTMSNLLKDLLPDAPREKSMLVAAAEAGLASSLRDHVAQGMDPGTAIRLTASSFSATTPFTPEACNWVAGEIAIALGISSPAQAGAGAGAGQFGGTPAGFDPIGQGQATQMPGFGAGSGQEYPPVPGFGQVPGQPGYQQTPGQGFAAEPAGYQSAPESGFPQVPATGFPQAPAAGYPQAPVVGYPQAPAGGYPQAPAGGYPQAPAGGYPQAPAGGYPQAQAAPTQAAPTPAAPDWAGQGYQQGYQQPASGQPGGYGGAGIAGGGIGGGGIGGVQQASPSWQGAGGYGIAGGVPGGPGGPRKPRRGMFIAISLVVVLIVIIAVVASVLGGSKKPTTAASSSPPVTSPTPTPPPSTTPPVVNGSVEPLKTIMNPVGLTPVGTSCIRAITNGLRASTLIGRTFCSKTTAKNTIVWGYQFDNRADYLAGFAHINSYTGFKASGASSTCPPVGGATDGSTGWHANSNPKYKQRPGQDLECYYDNSKPILVWTMPTQHVVFVSEIKIKGASLTPLVNWWKTLNYG
jgi:hypothetical protein